MQPSYAPFGQLVAKSGTWLPRIVNLTYCTPSEPWVGVTVFSRPRSAAVNVPEAATVQVTLSGEVSIWYWPVEELPASPQVALGSTAKDVMLTLRFMSTVRCLGTNTLVGVPLLFPVVLPQPVASERSRASAGPQPKSL